MEDAVDAEFVVEWQVADGDEAGTAVVDQPMTSTMRSTWSL